MNRELHCHTKFRVHATQRVLDLLKGLYSINNKFILFTHVLLANANVLPEMGKDFNLSSMACVIHPSVQLTQDATPIYINTSIFEGCFALTGFCLAYLTLILCIF